MQEMAINSEITNSQQRNIMPQSVKFLEISRREPRLTILFERFAAIFGHTWTSGLVNQEQIYSRMLVWESVIKDLTNDQIKKAIEKCKFTCEFISISKFRMAAFDITTPDSAYARIGDDEIATQAWEAIDAWYRKTGNERELKQAFVENYKYFSEKKLM